MKQITLVLLFVLSLAFYGCDSEATINTGGPPSGTQGAAQTPKQPAQEKAPAENAPAESVKKADVGATGKGKFADSAEKPMSIITVPLGTYFAAKEMAVFRIQIPEAMKLFHATNGRNPNSEQEFMQQIIKANSIALPELKPGDSYTYDVQQATLMVKSKRSD